MRTPWTLTARQVDRPIEDDDDPIDDEDNPEWTEEDFARAKPIFEIPDARRIISSQKGQPP